MAKIEIKELPVISPPREFIITLTEREAVLLAAICFNVRGNPENEFKKFTDSIGQSLRPNLRGYMDVPSPFKRIDIQV